MEAVQMPAYDNVTTSADPGPATGRPRWGFALLALVIAAGAGAWFYMANRPRPAKVVRQDIVGQVPMKGSILVPPDARADVFAPFAAAIETVHASVGSNVKKGDLLVKLQVTNAEAYYEQTKQALKQAETAHANAYAQLNAPVVAAQRQLDAARAAARSAAPAPEDPANPANPATPASTEASIDVASAEAALQQAIASRDSQMVAYRQHLDAARQANSQARAGERIGEVRAPITGTVLALNAQPGQAAGTDRKNPLATVVDLSAIQVEGVASREHSGYLKPGMDVLLSFKELPGQEFTGEISNVTTRLEERAAGLIKQQQIVAVIDFKNRDAIVRPGMTPLVAAKTGEAKDALAAPVEAVDTDSSGRPVLHVLRGSNWQDVAVTTGISDGRMVQIKTGVKEGETIKVTPDVLHAAPPLGGR
jgi:multidrug efflux pump subunit AcrA (membrane-fusion protein)